MSSFDILPTPKSNEKVRLWGQENFRRIKDVLTYLSGLLSSHSSDTTDIHGIADTTKLLLSLDTDVATVSAVSTTNETTLDSYTVAEDSIVAGEIIYLTAVGDMLKNAAGTLQLRLKFGATTVLDTGTFTPASDADRTSWKLEVVLAFSAVNAQRIWGSFQYLNTPSAATWKAPGAAPGAPFAFFGYATATEDTSAASKALLFTTQWSASSASLSIDRYIQSVIKQKAA